MRKELKPLSISVQRLKIRLTWKAISFATGLKSELLRNALKSLQLAPSRIVKQRRESDARLNSGRNRRQVSRIGCAFLPIGHGAAEPVTVTFMVPGSANEDADVSTPRIKWFTRYKSVQHVAASYG